MTSTNRRLHISRAGTWPVLLALVLALVPRPVLAADVRGGEATVIDAGTTVNDDLYVFGNTIDIQGTVNGDVIAGARSVTIGGTVNGDVIAAAGTIQVPGQIRGSIRASGGNLSIAGTVREDVLVGGGTLDVGPEASIGRDLFFGGGMLGLNGSVARNVRMGGGDVTLAGPIGGDVRAEVGQITVADSAVIQGDLTYTAEQSATIGAAATIQGQTQRLSTPEAAEPTMTERVMTVVTGWLRMLVAMMLVGLALVLLFPAFSRRAVDALYRAPLPSAGIGLALLVAVPLLAVVVLIAGIFVGGWWLAPILLGLFAATVALGYAVSGLFVGRAVFDQAGRDDLHPLVGLLAGLAILAAVGMVPYVGWIVSLVAAIAGLGALTRTLWLTRRSEPAVAPA